ncbi:MAG: hypothetical protein Tsb006_4290 [Rickettsiaceae bacterium]
MKETPKVTIIKYQDGCLGKFCGNRKKLDIPKKLGNHDHSVFTLFSPDSEEVQKYGPGNCFITPKGGAFGLEMELIGDDALTNNYEKYSELAFWNN